jgi:hypothetical protein
MGRRVKLVLETCNRGRSTTFTLWTSQYQVFVASVFKDLAGPPPQDLRTSRIPEPFSLADHPHQLDLRQKTNCGIFPKTRPAPEIRVWKSRVERPQREPPCALSSSATRISFIARSRCLMATSLSTLATSPCSPRVWKQCGEAGCFLPLPTQPDYEPSSPQR